MFIGSFLWKVLLALWGRWHVASRHDNKKLTLMCAEKKVVNRDWFVKCFRPISIWWRKNTAEITRERDSEWKLKNNKNICRFMCRLRKYRKLLRAWKVRGREGLIKISLFWCFIIEGRELNGLQSFECKLWKINLETGTVSQWCVSTHEVNHSLMIVSTKTNRFEDLESN